jgi:hypothetical protein
MIHLLILLIFSGSLSQAADNIIGIDGNNLLIDNSSHKWDAKVIYTTDGDGNVIPIGSSSITLGTVKQGGLDSSAAPWQIDLEQILGSSPSATNYLPSRITNGTSYVDPTQIRALSSGTDSVSATISNFPATQPVSAVSLPLPTGAAVAAKQPALGTAGSASSDVITVQGISSMTALKVDGSAVTQPVSGTVTANAGTGTFTISGTVTANAGTNLNTSALATSAIQSNGSQKSQVVDGGGNVFGPTTTISAVNYLPVIQASSATAGSTIPSRATLVAGSDGTNAQNLSVDSTGRVNINNIAGTISLPTGASSSANQTNGNQKAQQVDGSGNVQPAGDSIVRSVYVRTGDGTTGITVKGASTAASATDTSQVIAFSPNSPLPAGTNFIGAVSLGNSTGKSIIGVPGTLTSTATTADQVVTTYTVTLGKTFYLQNWDVYVQRSTFSTTAADYGTCSLEITAGNKEWTQELSGAGQASWEKRFNEPAPVVAGTVVRVVCTPTAATSSLWRANIVGYER